MAERKVPGGALAVVKDRKLVYAKGYGLADVERKASVTPESLFRIASISKPFTGVAVMQLVQQGKLSLDQPAFPLLGLDPLPSAAAIDPRLNRITIGQLLHHTGGWDRSKSGDPMFQPVKIARAAGTPAPAKPKEIIRYMLGQPLDFDPGSRMAYSNFGYLVLGRIIEKISGVAYADFVTKHVLARARIRRMRLGKSRKTGRHEVHYYQPDDGMAENVFPDGPREVPWPYGGFCLESMDAHGGWIASVVDLARFAAALDDPAHSPLLEPKSLETLYAPPAAPVSRKPDGSLRPSWYACGWSVRPVVGTGHSNYWHDGSLPGTASLLVRRHDGLSWAVIFNQRSTDSKVPDMAIDPALHKAADAVKDWPTHDLFGRYA